MLYRWARPTTLKQMAWEFGRQPGHLCECIIWMFQHVLYEFPHLEDGRSVEAWAGHFARFSAAIHDKAGPGTLTNCALLYDVKIQETTKPIHFQADFYTGFTRCHGLKWLEVAFPNGILPFPFGPVGSNEADPTVFVRSGLRRSILRASIKAGRVHCGYGDPAFGQDRFCQGPYKWLPLSSGEASHNTKMSKVRVPNEWGIGLVTRHFSALNFKSNLRIFRSPLYLYWPVLQILTNCHTCFYHNQISNYFKCKPPSVFEYVEMGRELPAPRRRSRLG